MPKFDRLTPDSIFQVEELNFSASSAAWPGFMALNNFAVLATTVLVVETPGTYEFFLGSDDGSLLFVDGSLLIDNNKMQQFKEKSEVINLDAGLHAIEVS